MGKLFKAVALATTKDKISHRLQIKQTSDIEQVISYVNVMNTYGKIIKIRPILLDIPSNNITPEKIDALANYIYSVTSKMIEHEILTILLDVANKFKSYFKNDRGEYNYKSFKKSFLTYNGNKGVVSFDVSKKVSHIV